MKLDDIKKQLRYVSNNEMYDFSSVMAVCEQSAPAYEIALHARSINPLKKIYEAYSELLNFGKKLIMLPDIVNSSRDENLDYFCMLYPNMKKLMKEVHSNVIPALSVAGFVVKDSHTVSDRVTYQIYEYNGVEYRVYYIETYKVVDVLESGIQYMEAAFVLYRIFCEDIEENIEDYKRFINLFKEEDDAVVVGYYGVKCFHMEPRDYLLLYIDLYSNISNPESIFSQLGETVRFKFLKLLDSVVKVVSLMLSNDSNEAYMKIVNSVLTEDTVMCRESALVHCGLIQNRNYPVSVYLNTSKLDDIRSSIIRSVHGPLAGTFIFCAPMEGCIHLYIPTRERALVEYAISAKHDQEVLNEAVINYLKDAESLDVLYDVADKLCYGDRIVDAMICTALAGSKVKDVFELS